MAVLDGFFVARHGTDKAITAAGNGLDEFGVIRRIGESIAQALDRIVQAILKVNEGAGGPQGLLDFFAGDEFARVRQENGKHVKRLVM